MPADITEEAWEAWRFWVRGSCRKISIIIGYLQLAMYGERKGRKKCA
jgi:hypothetical protein